MEQHERRSGAGLAPGESLAVDIRWRTHAAQSFLLSDICQQC